MIRFLLAALLICAPLPAQESIFIHVPDPTHPKDKTRVEVTALFSIPPPTGYLPVRVEITNQRRNDGSITLNFTSSYGYGENGSSLESSFAVAAKAGTTVTRDLLVPLATRLKSSHGYHANSNFRVTTRGSLGGPGGGLNSTFNPDAPAILMSEALHTPNASALDAELSRTAGGHGGTSFAARFEPTALPSDWRAYSGFDVMILTDDDWGKVDAGARNAITRWIRLGGHLFIQKLNEATTLNSLGIDAADTMDPSYGFGEITIESLVSGVPLDPSKTVSRFLGSTFNNLNESIRNDYSGVWPLHREFGQQTFNYAIFIIVLIGFGILVGPVNLFVFAKSGMRHKLFITTPLISLGTSVLLVILILLKDGTGGSGERIALIEVRPDVGENTAYVLQEQISRTGVLVGGSFKLNESAAISPVPIADSDWARLTPASGGGGMRYGIEQQEDHLAITGDWFQSRSEQGQLIRAVVPTRGRIEIKNQAGPPVLLSTFDFPLDAIYYRDRSDGFWVLRDLQPGNATPATAISATEYQTAVGEQALRLGERHRKFLNAAVKRTAHYVAITTAETPLVASFDSIAWDANTAILTGPAVKP